MFEKKISDEERKRIARQEKKEKRLRERELKKAQKADRVSVYAVIIPFVLAGIVVCLIYLGMKHQDEIQITETSVVVAKCSISENTYVSTDEIGTYFDVIKLDVTKIPENIFNGTSEFPAGGFYVENKLSPKQIVYEDDIAAKDTSMSKYKKKYYTTSMLVKTLANGVSGSIRKGNIVNIFAKNPETDELELLVKNVYVEEACNNSGESAEGKDGVALVYTIRVLEDEVSEVNKAIVWGDVQMYLVE